MNPKLSRNLANNMIQSSLGLDLKRPQEEYASDMDLSSNTPSDWSERVDCVSSIYGFCK